MRRVTLRCHLVDPAFPEAVSPGYGTHNRRNAFHL